MIVSEITRVDDVINGVGGGDRLGVMNRLGARRGRFEKTEMPDERTSHIRSGEKSLRVVTHGSEGGRSYSSEETLLLPRKEHHTIQNLVKQYNIINMHQIWFFHVTGSNSACP